jgi:hypothetical protein
VTSTPRTITEDELAETLAELGIRINGNAYFPELARNIFGYIERQREPKYEPGGIYQSPDGRTWFRLRLGRSAVDPDETPGWGWRCCESGTRYAGHVPMRPLRKLVPEGSQAEALRKLAESWRELASNGDSLNGVTSASLAYRDAAEDIRKLLEGGSDD